MACSEEKVHIYICIYGSTYLELLQCTSDIHSRSTFVLCTALLTGQITAYDTLQLRLFTLFGILYYKCVHAQEILVAIISDPNLVNLN